MKYRTEKRHLAKALTWRFVGTLDSFLLTWVITDDFQAGINISSVTTITKFIWYYLHEQIWFKSSIIKATQRHVLKTLTWRIVGTTDTILFGFIIIGDPWVGLQIGLVETISKLLLYYMHERIWYKVNFGLDRRILNNVKKTE